jgi:hypothetical protein
MTNPRASADSPAFVRVRSSVTASRRARISSTRSWSSQSSVIGRVPLALACSRRRPSSNINLPSPLSSPRSTSTWDGSNDPEHWSMSARSSPSSEGGPEWPLVPPHTTTPAPGPTGGAVVPFLFPRRRMRATALWVATCPPPSADVCSPRRLKRADLVSTQADEPAVHVGRAASGAVAARSVADRRPVCREPRGPSRRRKRYCGPPC